MVDVRFSFDDGLVGDIRAARLLTKYGFTGVFYVPNCPLKGTIQATLKEIKDGVVDLGHEIGGHTVSHPMDLKLVEDEKLQFEIINNKHLCEMVLAKKPCPKFCYPRGRHDERVRAMVKKCGFTEARTTVVMKIRNHTGDPYQTPTTVHMFPREEYGSVHWMQVARDHFFQCLKEWKEGANDVFFHLWGHTNELDRQGDWENFEATLKMIREELDLAGLSPEKNVANGAF